MSKRQHCLWSKKAGTEGLRIIASISWGCVGDGDAGISLSSSQSNGIYVQHGSLQQGNKYLYPPVTHCHSLASYSLHHLSIFAICAFIFPFSLSHLIPFLLLIPSITVTKRGKRIPRYIYFFLFFLYLHKFNAPW